jgi:O-antigen ligase
MRMPFRGVGMTFSSVSIIAAGVLGVGCGMILGLAGIGSDDRILSATGGGIVGGSLLLLLVLGAVDPLMMLALAFPLPAFYTGGGARIGPSLLLTLFVLFACVLRLAQPRPLRLHDFPFVSVALLGASLLLSSMLSAYRSAAIGELVSWSILIAFMAASMDHLRHTGRVHSVAKVVAAVCVICALLGTLESIGVIPGRFPRQDSPLMRAALGFGSPNELGIFIALGVPFVVHTFICAKPGLERAIGILALLIASAGLVATFSRGSWLSITVAPVFLFMAGDRKFALRCWVSMGIAVVVLNLASGGAISDRIAGTAGDWVIEQRFALMFAGLMMFLANPLLGFGPGSFDANLLVYGPNISWLWDYLPTAQNMYIQMAAEAGAVGLVALLFFLGLIARYQIRNLSAARAAAISYRDLSLHRAIVWAFGTACLLGMVEWVFSHGIGEQIMLIAAMGYALSNTNDAGSSLVVAEYKR